MNKKSRKAHTVRNANIEVQGELDRYISELNESNGDHMSWNMTNSCCWCQGCMKEIHHSVTCCCQFGLQLSQLKVIQVCCGILSFFLNGDHACPTETWITEETEGLLSSFLFSQSANETQCNLDWMRCTYWLQVWHIFMNIYCHIYLNLIIYPLRFLQNNGWIIDLTCDHQPLILCQQSTVHIYIL